MRDTIGVNFTFRRCCTRLWNQLTTVVYGELEKTGPPPFYMFTLNGTLFKRIRFIRDVPRCVWMCADVSTRFVSILVSIHIAVGEHQRMWSLGEGRRIGAQYGLDNAWWHSFSTTQRPISRLELKKNPSLFLAQLMAACMASDVHKYTYIA